MLYFKNEQEKILYNGIMEREDSNFDDSVKMIREWRGENGYHSKIVNAYVHPTSYSLSYAYELLNRGNEEDITRAVEILRKVVPLQDTVPDSRTYGIWSYYLEESLEEMDMPDWNWADFCGKSLLRIYVEYRDFLPEDVKELVKEAILHACNSIIRRNMWPGYTNISIMGTLVTMAAGENLGEERLVAYAKARLKTLYAFNMGHGCFQEYNSPSYTWVVLDDIASMIGYIKDEDSRSKFTELSNLAWHCIAEHYHYKTKQWAGPHARFYAMLEDDVLLMRVQLSLDYQISLVELDREGLVEHLPLGLFSFDSVCPSKYEKYFTTTVEGNIDAVFVRSEDPAGNEIAVCRNGKDYTLGSFYKSFFWNQKRNHISYFGTAEAPVYCAMKCLHDGYDYSSGLIVTAQDEMRTVSVIGFDTAGGDTHCNLDMVKDATIEAKDMRFRFEIGGAVDNVEVVQTDDRTFLAKMPGAVIRVHFPYASFGDETVRFEVTSEKEHINETGGHKDVLSVKCIDAVFYSGEKKKICFTDLKESCLAVSFEIASDENFCEKAEAVVSDGMLRICQEGLAAEAPAMSCKKVEFDQKARAYRGQKEYQEIYL